MFLTRVMVVVPALVCSSIAAFAQPAKFEDVVRNLRNPDQKIRVSAVRLLREAGYAEAIGPMAPLVNDPVNEIQLEAIDSPSWRSSSSSRFRRNSKWPRGRGPERRPRPCRPSSAGPLAVWPKPAPPELIDALLKALDDENKKVRLEAIYTLGVVGGRVGRPAAGRGRRAAAQGARSLRSGGPRRRGPRHRTAAGQVRGGRPAEGGQRLERAGAVRVDPRARRDSGTSQRRARAHRAAELLRQGRRGGGGARRARADRASVERAGVPVPPRGQGSLSFAARRSRGSRARATRRRSRTSCWRSTRTNRGSVRAAMAFALYKKGHVNYLARLIDLMDSREIGRAGPGLSPRARTAGLPSA